jgi:hypothetical protein
MAETIHAQDFGEFLGHCERLGIRAAAMQKVHEVRPQLHGGGVTVGILQRVTVLGYRNGTLVRAVIERAPADLRAELDRRGFEVREVWRNLD